MYKEHIFISPRSDFLPMNIFATDQSRSNKLRLNSQDSGQRERNQSAYGSLCWTFDPDNQYLPPQLTDFVYSKLTVRTVVVSFCFGGVLLAILPLGIALWYFVVIYSLIVIPFDVLIILSFNRDARTFILRSSEFWIKVIYAVLKGILEIVRYHKGARQQVLIDEDLPYYLGYLTAALALIEQPLMMVIVGGIDAIPRMQYKWKAILLCWTAGSYTWQAFHYQVMVSDDLDYVMHVQATNSSISIHSLISNTCGMLAIFVWKQTIDVLRNRDRCISITYRPYLKWERKSVENTAVVLDTVAVEVVDSTDVLANQTDQ